MEEGTYSFHGFVLLVAALEVQGLVKQPLVPGAQQEEVLPPHD